MYETTLVLVSRSRDVAQTALTIRRVRKGFEPGNGLALVFT
jgi:hypothetical protein